MEIDSENLLGLNTRSKALLKLNRSQESFDTIKGALRENPNNAYTHANYGWGLLEKGDHKKALVHFKESLKNNPNFTYAQSGMLEAIKAANPIYKLFLKYSFWMSKLTSKYQWGVIIGFYIGYRVLDTISKNNEALRPYLSPLLIGLALVAFSTWVLTPISNLFLRFNPYGQLLLDKNKKKSSNLVAASMATFVIGILLYFIFADARFLPVVFFGFFMMAPFSVMFLPSKYKQIIQTYVVTLAFVGISAVGFTFITGELINTFSLFFIYGFIAFQWVVNYLFIKEDNK